MVDTLFSDISYYQCVVDDSYPYEFLAIRSNDGTFQDPNFAENYDWCVRAVESGRMLGFLVYVVYRTPWQDAANTHRTMVRQMGGPHPAMASMIDMESWGGAASNQSAGANAMRENLIDFHGGNRKKVIAYANEGDRNAMWPSYGDAQWIIANYSYTPDLEDQIAHQFSSSYHTEPFGPSDINTANDTTPQQFAAILGLTGGGSSEHTEDDMGELKESNTGQTQELNADTPRTLRINDDNGLSMCHGPCKFQSLVQVSVIGLPVGKALSLRFTLWDVDDDTGEAELASQFPIWEIIGTSGSTFGNAYQQSHIDDPKGAQRRLRVQASTGVDGVAVTRVAHHTFVQAT